MKYSRFDWLVKDWPAPGTGKAPATSQAYELELEEAPVIGAGDLSVLFCLLTEAAAGNTSSELWGDQGFCLAKNGEHVWVDISKVVAEQAAKLDYFTCCRGATHDKDEALRTAGFEAPSWGYNSRERSRGLRSSCVGRRAR